MSLIPAINFRLFGYFWPVSSTPGKNVISDKLFAGVNDSTGDKLYWWPRSALAAKLSPAADIVIGKQPWKRAKAPHIPWSEAQEAAKTISNQNGIILFWRPQAPLIKMCGMFMDATFNGGSNDTIGGRGRLRRPEISLIYTLQLWQLPTSMASLFLSPAINLSPVSLSPAINCSPESTTPAITNNPWHRLIASVVDTGDKFFASVVDTAE